MLLVDSHCHLDCLDYQTLHQNIDSVLAKAKARNVGYVLSVATTLENYQAITLLISTRDDVALSCGVHPLSIGVGYDYNELRLMAASSQVVALGETGLDYFYKKNNLKLQQASFRAHIHIARDLHKPLIVHTRNACTDTLTILREENAQDCGGVLHCFTEDRATVAALLNLGFYISFSGIITFYNTAQLCEVARYVPLDRILVETDSPYLTPIMHRGKENQPAYVRDVANYLATLKDISLEKLAEATTNNFSRLFKINLLAQLDSYC